MCCAASAWELSEFMLPNVVIARTADVVNTAQLAAPAMTNLVRTVSGRTA
jgi:hypothetical protein